MVKAEESERKKGPAQAGLWRLQKATGKGNDMIWSDSAMDGERFYVEAEETEDIIVGAWAKDDGDLETGGNGKERFEIHFEGRSDKT